VKNKLLTFNPPFKNIFTNKKVYILLPWFWWWIKEISWINTSRLWIYY
jgi:hypothetical protein